RTLVGCSRLGAYELLNKLGEGTFGEVHKAQSHATRQLVALKRILMHEEREGIPTTALREVKLLKKLRHPNVVSVVDMVVTKGALRCSRYLIQVLIRQILPHLQNNILHRDMKAVNLLISNAGVLQIADFGLACPGHSKLGFPRRHRPPQDPLHARPPPRRGQLWIAIDMWGVGCVIGEMWFRRPMFCGSSDVNQLEKIWSLCGTPTEETMPGWGALPGCEGVKNWLRQERIVWQQFDQDAADPLDKMLLLDPVRRITAAQALDHEWFWSDPLLADPKTSTQYEASHEYDKRKGSSRKINDARPGRLNKPSPLGGPNLLGTISLVRFCICISISTNRRRTTSVRRATGTPRAGIPPISDLTVLLRRRQVFEGCRPALIRVRGAIRTATNSDAVRLPSMDDRTTGLACLRVMSLCRTARAIPLTIHRIHPLSLAFLPFPPFLQIL
ncbi:kinase-like protein, partial [Calocera viscosa TUFC12733]